MCGFQSRFGNPAYPPTTNTHDILPLSVAPRHNRKAWDRLGQAPADMECAAAPPPNRGYEVLGQAQIVLGYCKPAVVREPTTHFLPIWEIKTLGFEPWEVLCRLLPEGPRVWGLGGDCVCGFGGGGLVGGVPWLHSPPIRTSLWVLLE